MRNKLRIDPLTKAKRALLAELRGGVRDETVLSALARVPRERFVPPEMRAYAYDNRPLPIGYGQTISQPLIVAMMTEALALKGSEKVLEIGTGSGYQTAVLSLLADQVISVERVPELAEKAARTLSQLECYNVRVCLADPDVLGRPWDSPYDAIIVTASSPSIPQVLVDQLATGGRMVLPVGGRDLQELTLVTLDSEGDYSLRKLGGCRFVPLIGVGAWSESDAWEED